MNDTGAKLKAAREAAGLSLHAMAQRTHFSKGYLGNIEAGKRRVTPEVVAAYDRALGDDVDRRELLLGLMTGVVATLERAAGAASPDNRGRHVLRLLGQAHAAMGEGVRLAIEGHDLARSYDSQRHISRVQRMYDRLTQVWPRTEPQLVELHEALSTP